MNERKVVNTNVAFEVKIGIHSLLECEGVLGYVLGGWCMGSARAWGF